MDNNFFNEFVVLTYKVPSTEKLTCSQKWVFQWVEFNRMNEWVFTDEWWELCNEICWSLLLMLNAACEIELNIIDLIPLLSFPGRYYWSTWVWEDPLVNMLSHSKRYVSNRLPRARALQKSKGALQKSHCSLRWGCPCVDVDEWCLLSWASDVGEKSRVFL